MNPYQANAVKSLLNFEALVEPTHPLRQEVGDDEGVVFYVGPFASLFLVTVISLIRTS